MTAASTIPNAPFDGTSLVALLERQRTLYRQLRTLSDQQGPLVAESLAEPLLALLAQRQKLIDGVTAVNAELEPYRKRWNDLWTRLGEGHRRQVGDLVKEVETLLASIIKQDERDRGVLQTAKTQIAAEIQKISVAGSAVNAYRTPKSPVADGIARGDNRFTNQVG